MLSVPGEYCCFFSVDWAAGSESLFERLRVHTAAGSQPTWWTMRMPYCRRLAADCLCSIVYELRRLLINFGNTTATLLVCLCFCTYCFVSYLCASPQEKILRTIILMIYTFFYRSCSIVHEESCLCGGDDDDDEMMCVGICKKNVCERKWYFLLLLLLLLLCSCGVESMRVRKCGCCKEAAQQQDDKVHTKENISLLSHVIVVVVAHIFRPRTRLRGRSRVHKREISGRTKNVVYLLQ